MLLTKHSYVKIRIIRSNSPPIDKHFISGREGERVIEQNWSHNGEFTAMLFYKVSVKYIKQFETSSDI